MNYSPTTMSPVLSVEVNASNVPVHTIYARYVYSVAKIVVLTAETGM
jgi:hypothetical protein